MNILDQLAEHARQRVEAAKQRLAAGRNKAAGAVPAQRGLPV